MPVAFALQITDNNTFMEYLQQEKINLTKAKATASMLMEPTDQTSLQLQQQQNKELLAVVQGTIASLEGFLQHQRQQQQALNSNLKKKQQAPPGNGDERSLAQRIKLIEDRIVTNNKILELISDDLQLAYHYQETLNHVASQLEIWQAKLDKQQRLDNLRQQQKLLRTKRDALYAKNLALQQEQATNPAVSANLGNAVKVLLNNQSILLTQYHINQIDLEKSIIKTDALLLVNQDIKTLQAITENYKSVINQLNAMAQSINKMKLLLEHEQKTLTDKPLQHDFQALSQLAADRLQQLRSMSQRVNVLLEDKQLQLKKLLTLRQGLTEYYPESWPLISAQLIQIPAKFYHYANVLVTKVVDSYQWQTLGRSILDWVGLLFILLAAKVIRGLLRLAKQNTQGLRLSAQLYQGMLTLLYRNTPHIAGLSLLILIFFLQNISYAKYQLLIHLIFVWLLFRNFIIIARLILLEGVNDVTGQDVKLYHRFKWLLLFGGWTFALMVFSQELPLSIIIQDIFNRLFMLFLLAVAVVLWRSKDVIYYLLRPVLLSKKRYFRNAIAILIFLIPLILITTAIIGLVGYIHLAWTLSSYQAFIVLVIISYIVVRGLVVDLLELLSEWMVNELRNGWLWIEVFLKPLDKILRVMLVLLSIALLFQLFGWHSNSLAIEIIKQSAHYHLVDVSGINITLVSIIEFFILLCIFVWLAKWTREFCYRWLYRNVKDIGVRNSFSVFSQYTVVIIGVFTTLRVLGLDFSGMSMVLGGLAVGMGFGLRDFASNIVGGLILLIERPVREGDLITLGEYEGKVAHIGIRSMRVSSWDNMEVLIPNAETFNKPFTNWTHQDSVVRTVVPIKVNRCDDPAMIQALIYQVLEAIPEVLNQPTPQVLLTQIDTALLEFEVRYFINVEQYTRFEVRSKVLFAIMARFKEAGVHAPIPPFAVELTEREGSESFETPVHEQ